MWYRALVADLQERRTQRQEAEKTLAPAKRPSVTQAETGSDSVASPPLYDTGRDMARPSNIFQNTPAYRFGPKFGPVPGAGLAVERMPAEYSIVTDPGSPSRGPGAYPLRGSFIDRTPHSAPPMLPTNRTPSPVVEEEPDPSPGPRTYDTMLDISKPSHVAVNAPNYSFGPYGGPRMAVERGITRPLTLGY